MRKKLISLILAGGIVAAIGAYETDVEKFIPRGTPVIAYDIDRNGTPDFYWWNKNEDMRMTPDEIFIDLNQDGIPDISCEDLFKLYNKNYGTRRNLHI